ncbi:hypothetical protein FHX74_003592 [Friedmanniella endophytica]|uniref:Lsr2 protein n=1 Tax=Microlunatus kandeliicorticis TaxID=1759536 RepID=A0A7W3IVD2_9ACTN|nr:Lsr2 family protein [Microlunatus kandeliicorticis]MBA8795951.1 hypothetical protein [Microlunatus kandeliicorticis]
MAQKIVTLLSDDIDGTESDDIKTVTLSFEGRSVEVDLTPKNYDKLAKAVRPYLEAGRRVAAGGGRSGGRRSSTRSTSGGSDTQKIREWAEANGVEVSSRGRISAAVREQYEAAH